MIKNKSKNYSNLSKKTKIDSYINQFMNLLNP